MQPSRLRYVESSSMIRVAHIGPPRARLGGPSGYLDQLYQASRNKPGSESVLFPPAATPNPPASAPHPAPRLRQSLGAWKRRMLGPPKFWRPDDAALHERQGLLHRNMLQVRSELVASAGESIRLAFEGPQVQVLFTHDPFTAEAMLDRRTDQQVWMMVHVPFPYALFHAWSYAVPEKDWREIVELPDVRSWIEHELDMWRGMDRIILPCREAGEGFLAVDERFGDLLPKADFLLTGARGTPIPSGADRRQLRRRFGLPADTPVGLFLGRPQPYRGLDVLLDAVRTIKKDASPGSVAVAGPDKDSIPRHPRLLPLGRVSDVSGLLAAVDFVINVNRFCLFDLSTIEAAEAGKPMLLHAVGGNKTFRDLGLGCLMFDELSPDTVARALLEMFALPQARLEEWGRHSRTCYEAHLTPHAMWQRHLDLYEHAAKELATAD